MHIGQLFTWPYLLATAAIVMIVWRGVRAYRFSRACNKEIANWRGTYKGDHGSGELERRHAAEATAEKVILHYIHGHMPRMVAILADRVAKPGWERDSVCYWPYKESPGCIDRKWWRSAHSSDTYGKGDLQELLTSGLRVIDVIHAPKFTMPWVFNDLRERYLEEATNEHSIAILKGNAVSTSITASAEARLKRLLGDVRDFRSDHKEDIHRLRDLLLEQPVTVETYKRRGKHYATFRQELPVDEVIRFLLRANASKSVVDRAQRQYDFA